MKDRNNIDASNTLIAESSRVFEVVLSD